MDGFQLALVGMERASDHANRKTPGWDNHAYQAIVDYARTTDAPFMIEQVRKIAYDAGLPIPPAEGAWGTPTKRAASNGVIEFVGFKTSGNKTQHGKPCKLWKALRK